MAFPRAFLSAAAEIGYGSQVYGRVRDARHAAARYNPGIGGGTTALASRSPLHIAGCRVRVPELWGGLECSVNRIRDTYRDQTVLSGHQDRIEDLERFAEIGFRALRYPVLWERVAGESLEKCDWRWSDVRLKRIRSLGMRPIVGLLHHGSGPRYTDLLDEQFPAKLTAYARKVAERYPWADAYTPVNEPLTTARFSALYGFWYPHACDDRSFLRALFNEVMGTILAMRAI